MPRFSLVLSPYRPVQTPDVIEKSPIERLGEMG
jgi:hypothetical protein